MAKNPPVVPAAIGAALPLRPSNNMVCLIGHSMQDQALQNAFPLAYTVPRNMELSLRAAPAWVSLLSKGQFIFPSLYAFGVSGTTSYQMVALALSNGKTQLENAIASPCAIVYILTGHNDRNASFALDDAGSTSTPGASVTLPNLRFALKKLTDAGKIVILASEIPSGDATYTNARYSGTNLAYHLGQRLWTTRVAPSLYPGRVYSVDFWPALIDQSLTAVAGDIKPGFSQDGAHPNARASILMAKELLRVLQTLGAPPRYVPIHIPGDVYSVANPQGNLLSSTPSGVLNPKTLNYTAGGITASGTYPTGWGISGNSAAQAGTLTVNCAVVSTSPISGAGNWYEITITGTTAANALPTIFIDDYFVAADLANLNAGDQLSHWGEFEIDQTNGGNAATGLTAFKLILSRVISAGGDQVSVYGGDGPPNGSGVLDAILASQPLAGVWDGSGMYIQIDKTETSAQVRASIVLAPSATINIKVRMRNLAVRKKPALV